MTSKYDLTKCENIKEGNLVFTMPLKVKIQVKHLAYHYHYNPDPKEIVKNDNDIVKNEIKIQINSSEIESKLDALVRDALKRAGFSIEGLSIGEHTSIGFPTLFYKRLGE